jgi:MerR family redox-sensitive transcriptional activator SoxR
MALATASAAGYRKSMPRKPKQPLFTTGQVMKRTGLSRQVLYQYSTMGLIREQATTPKGHRRYGEDVFRRLELIRELNQTGYTLRDIKEIFFARAG